MKNTIIQSIYVCIVTLLTAVTSCDKLGLIRVRGGVARESQPYAVVKMTTGKGYGIGKSDRKHTLPAPPRQMTSCVGLPYPTLVGSSRVR